jgi:hypothetical protein
MCVMKKFGVHYTVVGGQTAGLTHLSDSSHQHHISARSVFINAITKRPVLWTKSRRAYHVSIEIHHAVGGFQELLLH